MNENEQDIPKEFHSFATGVPFNKCIECETDLRDKEYFIEKAIRTYPGFKATDVIFELAICMACAERLRENMSEKSLANMTEYMQKNTDQQQRVKTMRDFPNQPQKWIEKCLITGEVRNNMSEYQITAHCRGDKLILDMMPYMISGKALDAMTEILSDQTRDELDDFMGRHFGPPSLEKDLPRRRTILV